MSTELIRRFYKSVSVTAEGAGVMLDERRLRTPRGAVFAAPTQALAEAVAAEWDAQSEHIVPSSMPLTQLAFAAIDVTPTRRDELIAYIAKFGETDLCCHRAESPPGLVARQTTLWDLMVSWGEDNLGVSLPVVTGIVAAGVSPETLAKLAAQAGALDDFQLTALAQAAGLSGSVLIAFALTRRRIDAETAFAMAAIDDLYAQERWGEDAEAQARLDRQRAEFEAIDRFLSLLSA